MTRIFESGSFSRYRSAVRLDGAQKPIMESSQYTQRSTTVFLSHKHDELNELKDIIGFLEQEFGVKVYIDSRDTSLPKITSGETAKNIKERIKKCDRYILLATNGAIDSKWCNWELGIGDGAKFPNKLAIFPVKPQNSSDSAYKGNEYLEIYSYITYYNGTEKYNSGHTVSKGYYVRTGTTIVPLKQWLSL